MGLITMFFDLHITHIRGQNGFWQKKGRKVRNATFGGCTQIGKDTVKGMVSCRGVWGSSPRRFLDSRAASGANGPGSWKKVRNQTKVWRFCPVHVTRPTHAKKKIKTWLKNFTAMSKFFPGKNFFPLLTDPQKSQNVIYMKRQCFFVPL